MRVIFDNVRHNRFFFKCILFDRISHGCSPTCCSYNAVLEKTISLWLNKHISPTLESWWVWLFLSIEFFFVLVYWFFGQNFFVFLENRLFRAGLNWNFLFLYRFVFQYCFIFFLLSIEFKCAKNFFYWVNENKSSYSNKLLTWNTK